MNINCPLKGSAARKRIYIVYPSLPCFGGPGLTLKGRDIINIGDLELDEIDLILDTSRKMLPVARGEKRSKLLEGKVLASLFFEASTRTRLSFETAMH
ncbi:MAG: hypothetical protein JW939_08600, partial [Candidatus Thermoplasmatota archaeon]|nr:hypothetical protein [Candidatus Thermoplasmatota archaeon]